MTENLPALQAKAGTLRDYLNGDRIKNNLAQALPKWMSIDRLLRVVFTSTMKNPKLLDCTKESLLQSIMQCAQLGLEPILGRAYLIPYNNNKNINGQWVKVLECQFQPGYQGLVDLARRSGKVDDVYAQVVYENDEFDIVYGTERRLTHKPHIGAEPGKPIGAYTVWELSSGIKAFEFMPLHEIYKRRDKSQAYMWAQTGDPKKGGGKQDSIWHVWEAEQMRKTVIKHSAKLQPASIEFMEAVDMDNSTDLSRAQLGMFTGAALPEPEPPDTSKFDEFLAQKTVPDDLSMPEFLTLSAKQGDGSVEELKSQINTSARFTTFWETYENWRKDRYPDASKERAPANWWDNEKHWKFRRTSEVLKEIWEEHQDEFLAADPEMQKDFTDKFTKSVGYAPMEGPPEEEKDQGPGPGDDNEIDEADEIDKKLIEIRQFGGVITTEAKVELEMSVLPTTLEKLIQLKEKCREIYLRKNKE